MPKDKVQKPVKVVASATLVSDKPGLSKKAFMEAKGEELKKQNNKLTAAQIAAKTEGAWTLYSEAAKKAAKTAGKADTKTPEK